MVLRPIDTVVPKRGEVHGRPADGDVVQYACAIVAQPDGIVVPVDQIGGVQDVLRLEHASGWVKDLIDMSLFDLIRRDASVGRTSMGLDWDAVFEDAVDFEENISNVQLCAAETERAERRVFKVHIDHDGHSFGIKRHHGALNIKLRLVADDVAHAWFIELICNQIRTAVENR